MPHLSFSVDARGGGERRYRVTLELDAPGGAAVELFLPTWTPGSYLIREHQRHLGELCARDAATGSVLPHRKTAKNRFAVEVPPGADRRVRLEYAVYAHELTVRTAHLTTEHAFWNGVNLFLWPVGRLDATADVDVLLPPGWQLWCSLPRTASGDGVRLHARDFDTLADAPVLACASAKVVEFEALGRPHRFVFDGLGPLEPPASLAADSRAVIEQAARVFGVDELPYPSYEFLTLVSDGARGGLEHADCSVLLTTRTALTQGRGYREFLGLVAHEHFHVFNVKRMRPADLWQLDYERENHTDLLWVAEGFTAYYDDLLCRRAGILSRDRYLQIVADNIGDALRTPGRRVHSLADASYDAWIKFYRPDEDTRNSSQSYYVNGGLAAMCLDLTIRAATNGHRSLDDAMARLWRETWLAGRGYSYGDVVAAISHAAGQDLDADVARLVRGPFDPDFTAVLAKAGLALERVAAGAEAVPSLGFDLRAGGTLVAAVARQGSGAVAGLAPGDEILALRGLRVSAGNWDDVVRAVATEPGPIPVLFARQGLVRETSLTLDAAHPATTFKIQARADASPAEVALRDSWLGQG